MRGLVIVIAALVTLGLAAFGVIAAQKASQHGDANVLAKASTAPASHAGAAVGAPGKVASADPATPTAGNTASADSPVAPAASAPAASTAPRTMAPATAAPATTATATTATATTAPATTAPADSARSPTPNPMATAAASPPAAPSPAPGGAAQTPAAGEHTPPGPPAGSPQANADESGSGLKGCDKPGALGISRIVQIDTTGGPAFGFEHFKQYDFLHEHEVVLTFDDGPWPVNTPAVLKALTDECAKATFFEIGEHASWHPEISKLVAAAGMTVGSHTWSHKDLARNPYAGDIEKAKQEIELGVSAVHRAVDGPIAPFFRFPDLQQPPVLLSYLGQRNIATFSTDIDSFDFKMRHPQQVVDSVISKLKKRGKGIVLMHDFQRATGEAMPELLRQLKANGFKLVHMVPRSPVMTVAKYDGMLRQQDKLDVTNTRPESSVVRTLSGD